jgi:16S rRNA U1498 N3-methylase RsmE
MHSHNLYQVSDLTVKSFQDLIALFIIASGLPKTPDVHQLVATKCHELVVTSVQSWKQESVLIRDKFNQLTKTTEFQKLWGSAVEQSRLGASSLE